MPGATYGDPVTTELAVQARDVRVTYGETKALDGLDLDIPAATIHAILGPNGAGKTTFIRVATTLLIPTSGQVTVGGLNVVRDASRVRDIIGVAGQYATVDENLTGMENLMLTGTLYGLRREECRTRATRLLESFDLADAGGRVARTYSGGMRRRLDLAASLMGEPQILFLDEPTTGLDVRTRNALWEEVRAIAARGVTVVLTTQYLEEADALASSITIIDHGRVVASGTPEELKATVGEEIVTLTPVSDDDLPRLAELAGGDVVAGAVRVGTRVAGLDTILERVVGEVPLFAVSTASASLDDVFLAYTGHVAEDAPEPAEVEEPSSPRRRRGRRS